MNRKVTCMVVVNLAISIITLNVNALHKPVKWLRLTVDKKQSPTVCYPQETYFEYEDTDKSKGIRKMVAQFKTKL